MPRTKKIFLFVALPLVVIFLGLTGYLFANKQSKSSPATESSAKKVTKPTEKVVFTHHIFDPAKVSHITPLGELNGGHSEWQATTGVMINIKPEVVEGNAMIDVYAPTAMTLEAYSYHRDPRSNGNADWALIFRINNDVSIKFDHITKAVDKIVAVTTSTPKDRSNEEPPKSKIRFEAGELIAQTHGTKQAKNWNIYLTDKSITNSFINQARYEKSSVGHRFINGACPFTYYAESLQSEYLSLMGATKAGQANDCGNPSNDVAGTLSGTWFFDQSADNTTEQLEGNYASPLAVYKDSANRVIIDLIASVQFRIEGGADPATVTDQQCYKLVSAGNQPAGYAFFKLASPTSMKLAYSSSGSCPAEFPGTGAKTYYR